MEPICESAHNDHERALADLKAQLPAAVRNKHWPPSSRRDIGLLTTLSDRGATKKSDDDDDDGDSGMGSGLSIGMGSPGVESPTVKRRREEEEERQRQSRGRGQRMGGM